MDSPITLDTSSDEAAQAGRVAVLPVGSFEQHGDHLPLATDTYIASLIARALQETYALFLLAPLTMSCSHEHAAWPGTVSIRAATLAAVVEDVAADVRRAGAPGLLLVSGHGGNYVLSNVVQEHSVGDFPLALFPSSQDLQAARRQAGMHLVENRQDMHAGEWETSLMLHGYPSAVRDSFATSDHEGGDRALMLTTGLRPYTPTGVVGRPSLATAEKGARALEALRGLAKPYIEVLSKT